MVLIWGWGSQGKRIADIGYMPCSSCNDVGWFEIREFSKNFRLYFVPVVKWSRRYFIACTNCESGFEIESKKLEELREKSRLIPKKRRFDKMWEHLTAFFGDTIKALGDNSDLEELKNWPHKAACHLRSMGYRDYEIDYIIPFFMRFAEESFQEGNQKYEAEQPIYCPYCGTQLIWDARFCKKCGKGVS